MRETVKQRTPNGNFDLVFEGPLPEFFAEGMAQMLVGHNHTKVSFYSSAGGQIDPVSNELVERREVKYQITMPTVAWLEFASLLVAQVKQFKGVIDHNTEASSRRLNFLLSGGDPSQPTNAQEAAE